MKKKIAITGAKGVVGKVLTQNLKKDYQILALDLPEYDVRNLKLLLKVLKGCFGVVHLAWKYDDYKEGKLLPDNFLMTINIYEACFRLKIKRVIMASSLHADSFYDHKGKKLLRVDRVPWPDSLYGAEKVFMEALGRYYAKYKNLEVICLRLGGVNEKNTPFFPEKDYSKIFLSHEDLISLVKTCLEAKKVPQNFVIINAISRNKKRVHSWKNPFSWKPQ